MKFSLIVLFIFLCPQIMSQSNEVKAARLKIIEQLNTNNLQSDDYMISYGQERFYYLSMREIEWMSIFSGDYEKAVLNILSHEANKNMYLNQQYRITDFDSSPRVYRYVDRPLNDSLELEVEKYFEIHFQNLINAIRYADIGEEKKLFLVYYMYFNRYQIDICNENKQLQSIDEAKKLLSQYPNSSYKSFVYRYSEYFRKEGKVAFDLSVGFGSGMITDGLKEHFNPLLGINTAFNFYYSNIGVGFTLPMIILNTQKPFEGVFESFEEDRKARLEGGGIHLIYNFTISRRVALSPFIGYSYNTFRGLYNSEEEAEILHFKRLSNWAMTYGLNLDIGLKHLGCDDHSLNNSERIKNSPIFFRFQAGLINPELELNIEELDGSFIFLNFGLGYYFRTTNKKSVLDID